MHCKMKAYWRKVLMERMRTVRKRQEMRTTQISLMKVVRVAQRRRQSVGRYFLMCAWDMCSVSFLIVTAWEQTWSVITGTKLCALLLSGASATSTSVVACPNWGSLNVALLWPMPAPWESTWRGWKYVCVRHAGLWLLSDWSKPYVDYFQS